MPTPADLARAAVGGRIRPPRSGRFSRADPVSRDVLEAAVSAQAERMSPREVAHLEATGQLPGYFVDFVRRELWPEQRDGKPIRWIPIVAVIGTMALVGGVIVATIITGQRGDQRALKQWRAGSGGRVVTNLRSVLDSTVSAQDVSCTDWSDIDGLVGDLVDVPSHGAGNAQATLATDVDRVSRDCTVDPSRLDADLTLARKQWQAFLDAAGY